MTVPDIMFLFLLLANAVNAALPQVDFNRMGTVGLAGSFAGFDFFQNSSLPFDASTSTLFSRTSEGALTAIGTTNNGGHISAGCTLNDVFYVGGSFSSLGGTSASNVASYRSSSSQFSALGSNGPDGEVDAIYCDTKNGKVWVGGKFTSPGSSVAVWDTKAGSWSQPPFAGVTGAQSRVFSITTNSSQSSLFFAGSFVASFQGNGTFGGNNNPNVPSSPGATPFSSSLVPISLDKAQIEGSPSTTDSQFNDVKRILCPAGSDGPGNTWFGADGTTAVITARAFSFITASGIRLGNTFLPNHGTSEFSVTTIPDNTVQTLKYFDPTTGQNATCTDPCPLSSDSSILYQDYLFPNALSITGVQIKLSKFTGSSPGLHMMQILSSGAFASAVADNNTESCFATAPPTTGQTGNWQAKVANTEISGTVQTVLVASVDVGTTPEQGPSFTWMPYVSASGTYEVSMMIPGCTNFQDCGLRTSVTVTMFPGPGLNPVVATIDQTNTDDATKVIYNGPIVLSSPEFTTTVSMRLADNPTGSGQDGKYELVADRVVLSLTAANTGDSGGNSSSTSGGVLGSRNSFGFLEWPLSASSGDDATKVLPNNTITTLDSLGTNLFNALGGSSSINSGGSAISSVVHHPSGSIYLGGNLTLSNGAKNVVAFANGVLSPLGDNGVNGPVAALLLVGDILYVGGAFQDTASGSTNGQLRNIGAYNVQTNTWTSLSAGLNGPVTGLNFLDGKLQVTGSFTQIFTSFSGDSSADAAGLAVWDAGTSSWVNSGGFIAGNISMVTNGTESTQYLAGNVATFRKFGASGMVMINNSDGEVHVSPLGTRLETTAGASTGSTSTRRRSLPHARTSWMSHVMFPRSWSKRQSSSPSLLPPPLLAPAPAVLAGAFWTNTSTKTEMTIIGGNFSFLPTGTSFGSQKAQGVAVYDPSTGSLQALQGSQINGTVRTLFVQGNNLFVGGQFTLSGTNANGFAVYNLVSQQWDTSGIQPLQASGSTVVVRSISSSQAKPNNVIVAGSFAQAGSLSCQAICFLDTSSRQWNALGSGILGEVAGVGYGGNNQDSVVIAGSIVLSGSTANVVQYTISNNTWTPLGSGSDIPGPVTAIEVNGGNINSVFAAGKSSDSSFLAFYNGIKWTLLASTLQKDSVVNQLTMVPLQTDHTGNAVVEGNRMLMISGSLDDSSFGNASSALFDGQIFIPYAVSTTSSGTPGFIAALFHSFKDIDFNKRRFLATGIVILISIAISAGVVFLLALIGILWTLFSRRDRDDKINKYDPQDDDDDSMHHRPSSLLEHVNAATRGTIVGVTPSPFAGKVDDKGVSEAHDHDPYGPDASNYARAETPSDAIGGLGMEEASRPAHARYSFDGVGEGELPLTAGAGVEILDDRDHAWWYARDIKSGREGVVPAAYLY